MRKSSVLCLLAFHSQILLAGIAIVPGDEPYYKIDLDDHDVEMIYTEQNQYAAEQAVSLEPTIIEEYEKYFGFSLDQTLYVGIISQRNQVANGFSTQFPLNMQINYMGGTQKPDYFTASSWLNTLLYHETAHNYQLNPKASGVTRGLHSALGNSALVLGIFPLLAVPNAALTSFPLEGNAVLNESWHDNGGRLYSGRLRAESILQAKAGHITAEFLFNQTTHEFPYYDRHYIIGGFFQLYLAEKYGLEKTNSFFYNHSKSWLWPFRTNHIHQMSFGENFEQALAGYNDWLLQQADGFIEAGGERIATSMYFASLNNDRDQIYFLISDAQRAPELVRIGKSSKSVEKKRRSYLFGKVIKTDDEYTTQASGHTNPTRIMQGLFNRKGRIVKGTESRMIQGYLKDGTTVYFDVPSSFSQPQLYVGDKFYATVNSSVYIDGDDNLYYFVQRGKTRTLFRNKEPLYSMQNYYGIVSDVDSRGRIYFVGNSPRGSSLYRLDGKRVERVSRADNVVEARLVNDEEVLIAAIGQQYYYYAIDKLVSSDQAPSSTRLFFEDEPYFGNAAFTAETHAQSTETRGTDEENAGKNDEKNSGHKALNHGEAANPVADNTAEKQQSVGKQTLGTDERYHGISNLHYAGTSVILGLGTHDEETVGIYSINAQFHDPLLTNSASLFASQGLDRVGLVGAGYRNTRHLLSFGASVYGVYNEGDAGSYYDYDPTTNTYGNKHDFVIDSRDYGLTAFTALPIIKTPYNDLNIALDYYQDYDSNARSPLTASVNFVHAERYGQAIDYDYLNALSIFGSLDRGDRAAGFDYQLSHGIPWKLFLGMGLQGVGTDYDGEPPIDDDDRTRGIKFTPYQNPIFNDPGTIVMPSLEHTRYVKQAAVAEINIKKQFDGRALYFTFPFSLTREIVYAKQRYYNIQDFGQAKDWNEHTVYNETTLGFGVELLFLNKITLPLSFEYIYNDNTEEEHHFRFLISAEF